MSPETIMYRSKSNSSPTKASSFRYATSHCTVCYYQLKQFSHETKSAREEKSKFSKENNNNTIIICFQNIAKHTKTVKHYIQVNTNVPQDRMAKI